MSYITVQSIQVYYCDFQFPVVAKSHMILFITPWYLYYINKIPIFFRFIFISTLGMCDEAVSYTHLDVYKRQEYRHNVITLSVLQII